MFDLMYVNQHIGDRQYAFLRKEASSLQGRAGGEALLVVVNFADEPASIDVSIPSHAFDYLGLAEGEFAATDLLTDEKCVLPMKADVPIHVEIPPCNGRIYKI